MAASALGMPVQVFPTGPPVPPPAPKQQLAPTNGSSNRSPVAERKSPVQAFDPPPMGFRPEIKIPPNPMASLKPTPKPQPKEEFWVEEYKKERSKSPMLTKSQGNFVSIYFFFSYT